ncbi:MAG: hypothetical protein ACO33C_01340 [Gammaproteobacteria bacterium]|jgi:hypothetical protein
MKFKLQLASIFFALSFCTKAIEAQEYTWRSEFFWCKLNPGKTVQDVVAENKKYGEFSKSQGTQYMQAVMVPMHAGDQSDYDYIIWGSWPDGESMYKEWGSYANDYEDWTGNQDEDSSASSAGKCFHQVAMFNHAVAHNRIPWEERDQRTPIQFSNCKFTKQGNLEKLVKQYAREQKALDAFGFKGWGSHVFVPYLGFTDEFDADYVAMNHWYSFDARADMAQNYQSFVEANPDFEKEQAKISSCSGGNSFILESIFNNFTQ